MANETTRPTAERLTPEQLDRMADQWGPMMPDGLAEALQQAARDARTLEGLRQWLASGVAECGMGLGATDVLTKTQQWNLTGQHTALRAALAKLDELEGR